MFLELINFLTQFNPGFDVLHYLTVRAVLAMLAALFISLTLGHFFIARLQQYQIKQVIRPDGPKTHLSKAGTPTMGGVMILFSFISSIVSLGLIGTNAYLLDYCCDGTYFLVLLVLLMIF